MMDLTAPGIYKATDCQGVRQWCQESACSDTAAWYESWDLCMHVCAADLLSTCASAMQAEYGDNYKLFLLVSPYCRTRQTAGAIRQAFGDGHIAGLQVSFWEADSTRLVLSEGMEWSSECWRGRPLAASWVLSSHRRRVHQSTALPAPCSRARLRVVCWCRKKCSCGNRTSATYRSLKK